MTYKININSVSDIITNSSSEIYTIKSDIPDKQFREMWDQKLLELGYSKEEIENDDAICGEIYMENGTLYLDYPVLCNISDSVNILGILKSWFGDGNVTEE